MSPRRVRAWSVAVLLSAAAILVPPAQARACSKLSVLVTRGPRLIHFLGVAQSDTLEAGAGKVTYRVGQGHFGRGTERNIYGQLVDVEQLGAGTALAVVAGAVRQIVLVPWDYGADCHPVPWSRSVRWVPPGTRGLFHGVLRDSAHWVAGIPTLDVHEPRATPYPFAFEKDAGLLRRRERAGAAGVALTAEQLLGLYNVMPAFEEPSSSADTVLEPLRQWMRDHPDELARFPAPEIIRQVFWGAEYRRVRALHSPIAGTYRFALVLATGDSLVFFARTTLRPTSALHFLTPSEQRERPREELEHRAQGYYLTARSSLNLAELPRAVADFRNSSVESHGYVAAAEKPSIDTRDSTTWQGSIDLLPQAARLAQGDMVRREIERANAILGEMLRSGQRSFAPGYFVRSADGSIRYTMTAIHNGTRVLEVRGERISVEYLADR